MKRHARARRSLTWFVCELVHECRLEGVKSGFVWVNIHMIAAADAEDAYSKAIQLGRSHNRRYLAGDKARPAQWKFRGIRELVSFIDQKPKDGCELMFETYPRKSERGIRRMLTRKRDLSVFRS